MIDYTKISTAIKCYKDLGYQYIDVPWLVSKESMMVTSPEGKRLFTTFAGELVASGEQSFIEMRKVLNFGKYVCATPCFRDETIDRIHHQYFFKVELIDIYPEDKEASVQQMIKDAAYFFNLYLNTNVTKTDIGYDLTYRGIELGSYGNRTFDNWNWTYGTGCAEPRLSQALAGG